MYMNSKRAYFCLQIKNTFVNNRKHAQPLGCSGHEKFKLLPRSNCPKSQSIQFTKQLLPFQNPMTPNGFDDVLTIPLVPPAGWHLQNQ